MSSTLAPKSARWGRRWRNAGEPSKIGSARADALGNCATPKFPPPGGAAVCVKASGMKTWHLAASDGAAAPPPRRSSGILEKVDDRDQLPRDSKDLRFGMGMSTLRIDDPQRRDRLLMSDAIRDRVLTLLTTLARGAADRREPAPPNEHVASLFQQGCLLYDLIPNMPDDELQPLIQRYQEQYAKVECFQRLSGARVNERKINYSSDARI